MQPSICSNTALASSSSGGNADPMILNQQGLTAQEPGSRSFQAEQEW